MLGGMMGGLGFKRVGGYGCIGEKKLVYVVMVNYWSLYLLYS